MSAKKTLRLVPSGKLLQLLFQFVGRCGRRGACRRHLLVSFCMAFDSRILLTMGDALQESMLPPKVLPAKRVAVEVRLQLFALQPLQGPSSMKRLKHLEARCPWDCVLCVRMRMSSRLRSQGPRLDPCFPIYDV